MAKKSKQSVVEHETTFDLSNVQRAESGAFTPTKEENRGPRFRNLNMVVSPDIKERYDVLFKRFVKKTDSYWYNVSRVNFFDIANRFLEHHFKEKGTYKSAPAKFIKFITRKGNRPKSERHFKRKDDGRSIYLRVESHIYDNYINLMYTFLSENDDITNTSYSVSYFLQDFLNLLQENFSSFCSYQKKREPEVD